MASLKRNAVDNSSSEHGVYGDEGSSDDSSEEEEHDNEESVGFKLEDSSVKVGNKFASFTIHGKPRPMQRYKRGRGRKRAARLHSYNPSKGFQKLFGKELAKAMEKINSNTLMFIKASNKLCVKMNFFLRRPNSHFVKNNRQGKLRPEFRGKYPTVETADVDNLAKFVLDSMEKAKMIENDCWVVELWVTKNLENGNKIGHVDITVEDLG